MSKRSNCLFFAFKKWKLDGGYLCIRASRHKHWWPVNIHVLWHPDGGDDFESFVPEKEELGKFPPPVFKGYIKKGD